MKFFGSVFIVFIRNNRLSLSPPLFTCMYLHCMSPMVPNWYFLFIISLRNEICNKRTFFNGVKLLQSLGVWQETCEERLLTALQRRLGIDELGWISYEYNLFLFGEAISRWYWCGIPQTKLLNARNVNYWYIFTLG